MRRLYTLLLWLLLPLALLRLLWRSLRAPEYRRRWAERFGVFPGAPLSQCLWLHAVSVGEVQAAAPLIKQLRQRHPELPALITTTTPTGSRRVRELFGNDVFHAYLPYDIPLFLSYFLDAVQPRAAVIVETEIWPNLLAACEQRGIPCILANARLSARSAAGYHRFGFFTRETLRRFTVIAAQGRADAERFLALGADPARVQVTGSIKFDLRLPASLHEEAQVLRRLWGTDRPVWVAASTHEGEDEPVLEAHRRILGALPASLLVLVPRHPERFVRTAALVAREGFSLVLRSERQPCGPDTQVFLGDSMGELRLFLAAADAAFIGGSLVERGGHNVLEPAALGLPVVFGPHMFNFAEIGRLLVDQGAAVQVQDGMELGRVMMAWLQDASERTRIGELGRQVVARNRGALDRLSRIIEEQLAAPEP